LVRAFRSDPEVVAALRAAPVDQLALPTLRMARPGGTSGAWSPMLLAWERGDGVRTSRPVCPGAPVRRAL